jgi:hypothetical protein
MKDTYLEIFSLLLSWTSETKFRGLFAGCLWHHIETHGRKDGQFVKKTKLKDLLIGLIP